MSAATVDAFAIACVATTGADGLVRIDHSACGDLASCHVTPSEAWKRARAEERAAKRRPRRPRAVAVIPRELADERVAVPACQYGPTGHCANGKHADCAHGIGGPQENGVRSPSGYVTDRRGRVTLPPVEVGPWHVWRCPCKCHAAGQVFAPRSRWTRPAEPAAPAPAVVDDEPFGQLALFVAAPEQPALFALEAAR